MKEPTLTFTRVFVTAYILSLTALPLAEAAGCAGLGDNGSFAKGLQDRKGAGKEKCGPKCQKSLQSLNNRIKHRLNACKSAVDASTDYNQKRGGLSLVHYQKVDKRLESAQKTHKDYVSNADKLCHKYGAFANDPSASPAAMAAAKRYGVAPGSNGLDAQSSQNKTGTDDPAMDAAKRFGVVAGDTKPSALDAQSSQNKTAALSRAAKEQFGSFKKDAKNNAQALDQGLPGNQKGVDPEMKDAVASFKYQLTRQIEFLKNQAKKKIAERKKDAESGWTKVDNPSGAVRFKTQADLDRFYKGIDKCNLALKDLNNLEKSYKKLSDDLADAKKETKDAEIFFAKQEFAQAKQESATAMRASGMDSLNKGSNERAEEGRNQVAVQNNGEDNPHTKTKSAPSAYSQAQQDELISKGQISRNTAIGGSVLGTFNRNGQVFEVMGAKSYDGNTPYYARPKK